MTIVVVVVFFYHHRHCHHPCHHHHYPTHHYYPPIANTRPPSPSPSPHPNPLIAPPPPPRSPRERGQDHGRGPLARGDRRELRVRGRPGVRDPLAGRGVERGAPALPRQQHGEIPEEDHQAESQHEVRGRHGGSAFGLAVFLGVGGFFVFHFHFSKGL